VNRSVSSLTVSSMLWDTIGGSTNSSLQSKSKGRSVACVWLLFDDEQEVLFLVSDSSLWLIFIDAASSRPSSLSLAYLLLMLFRVFCLGSQRTTMDAPPHAYALPLLSSKTHPLLFGEQSMVSVGMHDSIDIFLICVL
jgi:hypothetical protein